MAQQAEPSPGATGGGCGNEDGPQGIQGFSTAGTQGSQSVFNLGPGQAVSGGTEELFLGFVMVVYQALGAARLVGDGGNGPFFQAIPDQDIECGA